MTIVEIKMGGGIMDFQNLIFEKRDGIGIVTLNRPERLNALSQPLMDELASVARQIAQDEEVRVLVLTGAGRAFCAGGDFKFSDVREGKATAEGAENMDYSYARQGHLLGGMQGVILAIRKLEIPTIAMVNGPAVGAGFDLALACDLRTGSDSARFMVALTRMGLNPGATGGTWLLPRIIGIARAIELYYTADFCEAEEAYRVGLLNRLVPAAELEKATFDLARRLAQGPPVSYRLAKMQTYKSFEVDFETALAFGNACENICLLTEDHQEGIKAFAEKRPPLFKGK